MPRFNDNDVRAILMAHEANSYGGVNTEQSKDREDALRRYRGDPQGDEIEGQSQVVMTDTQDAVESVLPSLLRIFMSGKRVGEFVPENPEDEDGTDQATDYINYLFMRENDGFNVLYTAFKDALMYKNGLVKVYWDAGEQRVTEEINGLDESQLAVIADDPNIEILAQDNQVEQDPITGEALVTYDLKIERLLNRGGRLRVEPVPPEEYIYDRLAKNNEDYYSAHVTYKTEGELIASAKDYDVSVKQIKALPTSHGYGSDTSEVSNRFPISGSVTHTSTQDTSTRYIRVTEHYVDMDYDGDGVAEKRMVTTFGDSNEVIAQNVPLPDGCPIVDFSIIRMQHAFEGRSLDDLVKDVAQIKTAVIRQVLNNFYHSNFPKRIVDTNHISIDDLLSSAPNQVIRGNPAHYQELPPMTLGSSPFNLLEYMETVKENRTGITRANQGLEADTLNKTATGISLLLSASQQRQELMTRLLAKGVERLFKLMLRTVSRHQNIEWVVRLNNKWVSVDPRLWNSRMDASVNVGLGSGNKEQQIGALLNIKQLQVEAIQFGQATGVNMVGAKELYNTYSRIAEVSGFQEADDFFIKPDDQMEAQDGQQQGQQQGQQMPQGITEQDLIEAQQQLMQEGAI